ncbi:MAG: GDP-L-fucose synthase [Bacteroidota bacterium]|nr:GDP-L-fucose synthase [Bacteroidota bacterium]
MTKDSKIYVAGHRGLVGSAIVNALKQKGYKNFVFTPHADFDLRNQKTVQDFFSKEKPDYVFLAAAKVGGILANTTYRADFIYDNLQIQNNIIHQAYVNNVKKLIFLGSSCIYPKESPQPMREDYLLTDSLEYTNEPYAIAKIAGIKLCESFNLQYGTDFISVMPTNLYGRNDNFDLEKSHVLPALIRKLHLAKALSEIDFAGIRKDISHRPVSGIDASSSNEEITRRLNDFGISPEALTIWGTGKPRREFLHADDLGNAVVELGEKLSFKDILKAKFNISKPEFPITKSEVRNTHINLGTGKDISIGELAELIKTEVVDYKGRIFTNPEKPDGTFQKLLDVSVAENYGIKAKISLKEGLRQTYAHYCRYE